MLVILASCFPDETEGTEPKATRDKRVCREGEVRPERKVRLERRESADQLVLLAGLETAVKRVPEGHLAGKEREDGRAARERCFNSTGNSTLGDMVISETLAR